MFQRILVPLDGSDQAEQAIPVAARLARASGGTVILVQVAPLPAVASVEQKFPAEEYFEDVVEDIEALPMNYLAHVSAMAELVGVRTETRVEYGEVTPSILAAVEPLAVDLTPLPISSGKRPNTRRKPTCLPPRNGLLTEKIQCQILS